jgi:small subunit ribosomal protein S4
MRYTGPKFKLCRREGVNLFGTPKYDVRKRRTLPGQHGGSMSRLSEYGKLLRNKQVLKRIYQMTEKQFKRFVTDIAAKYSKNHNIDYDKAVKITLERRLDAVLYRSGIAKTIIQARQMITHGHFLLNGKKHNIPSYLVKQGDVLELKEKLKNSPLYAE